MNVGLPLPNPSVNDSGTVTQTQTLTKERPHSGLPIRARGFSMLIDSLKNLIYPAQCLHCNAELNDPEHPLCNHCLTLMNLIDPLERCPRCFSNDFCLNRKLCSECLQKPPVFDGIAAAFDYAGPAATLIKRLKYSNRPALAQGCGAYLAAQFLRLDWPMPDLIIPMPIAFNHLIMRGYNQSLLLAETLSTLLQRPVREAVIRKSGDYSQAGLMRNQRLKLGNHGFVLRKRTGLEEKCVLLVDDVITTGATLHRCAEALSESYPSKIYALAVCRAFK